MDIACFARFGNLDKPLQLLDIPSSAQKLSEDADQGWLSSGNVSQQFKKWIYLVLRVSSSIMLIYSKMADFVVFPVFPV